MLYQLEEIFNNLHNCITSIHVFLLSIKNSRLCQSWCDCVLECRFLPLGKPRREVGVLLKHLIKEKSFQMTEKRERESARNIHLAPQTKRNATVTTRTPIFYMHFVCGTAYSTLPTHFALFFHIIIIKNVFKVNKAMK